MSAWEVGQQVIKRRPQHRGPAVDTEETITRVGRKYVYLAGRFGREDAYDATTGIVKDGGNYASRIYTPEALAEKDYRDGLLSRVAAATRDYSWYGGLGNDELARLLAIIEANPAVTR